MHYLYLSNKCTLYVRAFTSYSSFYYPISKSINVDFEAKDGCEEEEDENSWECFHNVIHELKNMIIMFLKANWNKIIVRMKFIYSDVFVYNNFKERNGKLWIRKFKILRVTSKHSISWYILIIQRFVYVYWLSPFCLIWVVLVYLSWWAILLWFCK